MHKPNLLPLFIFGTLLISTFAIAVIISIVIQRQRQTRNRLTQQRREFEFSQNLLHTQIEVQETTLNTIAQELHDNVAQVLTASFLQLAMLEQHIPGTEGNVLINEVKTTIKTALSDIRLLSHSLASSLVERREIEEAIQSELDRIGTFSNIICSLEAHAEYDPVPEQRLLIFRIIQEALQNIVKHADATEIQVVLSSNEDIYCVIVQDNGNGFDVTSAERARSLGIINMKERAGMLKGKLHFVSEFNKGTIIKLEFPIQHYEKDTRGFSG